MLLQDRCGSIGACLCRARKPEAADRADESEKQPPLHDRAQTRPGPPRKHPKFSAVVPALALRSLSDLSGCRFGREALVPHGRASLYFFAVVQLGVIGIAVALLTLSGCGSDDAGKAKNT